MAKPLHANRAPLSLKLRFYVAKLISKQTARIKLRQHYYRIFRELHPSLFIDANWRHKNKGGTENECSLIYGHVVAVLERLREKGKKRLLLSGENTAVKRLYADILQTDQSHITTVGLSKDVDFTWNFEQDPPAIAKQEIIVSHAILEHLINPYKHVGDLLGLLEKDGYLVLYTVLPGFPYHAYPIDCLRFFPDWFVAVADRYKVDIFDSSIGEDHMVYTFHKVK